MPNITKLLLRDEVAEHREYLNNKYNSIYDGSFSDYLEKTSKGIVYISDFIQWFIERNYKN
jgi:hypothetical protein